jgi:hypothetical protein
MEYAHGKNMPEGHARNVIEWYLNDAEQSNEQQAQRANDMKLETMSSLKAEWGPEFTGNINAIDELFVDHPDIKDILLEARGEDGLPIGNNAAIVRWAVDQAKKANPLATFTLPGGENGIKALDSRLGELKDMMTNDRQKWFKSPELQSEYDDLITKRDKVKR